MLWVYLFYSLQCYGFGSLFSTLLQTLDSAFSAQLMIKDYSSQHIQIHRGTQQSCSLSPILYILDLEPLTIQILEHLNIKGIFCRDREHKCALFADNLLMILFSLVTFISNLCLTLRHFKHISGLPVNHSKSLELNTVYVWMSRSFVPSNISFL